MSDLDLAAVAMIGDGMTILESDATERATERVRAGKCIHCDKESHLRRGLCTTHYQQFYLQFVAERKLGERKAKRWLSRLIRQGMVLPSGIGKRERSRNVFKNI